MVVMPKTWQMKSDPDGRDYFVNTLTGLPSWDMPKEYHAAAMFQKYVSKRKNARTAIELIKRRASAKIAAPSESSSMLKKLMYGALKKSSVKGLELETVQTVQPEEPVIQAVDPPAPNVDSPKADE